MKYLPFKVIEFNDTKPDMTIELNSDSGHLYVELGKLAISIKQSDDGLGVIIECTDIELYEQELGSMSIWYEDIQELPDNEDGTYPIH